MAYNENAKPEPHYTVHIKVTEVTPGYRTGSGVQAMTYDRKVEEVVILTVRADNEGEAIEKAIAQLQTAASS